MGTTFASSRSVSTAALCPGTGPLTASISFCEIGLKRFSSVEANLAIDYFPFPLRFRWYVHFDPFKRVESRFELARELSKLVCHLMGRIQLEHSLSLLLTFTDVCRFSNLGLIASDERVRSLVKRFLDVGNQLPLDPSASPFDCGQDDANQTQGRVSLLSHRSNIRQRIIETFNRKRFRNRGEQEVISRLICSDGWYREIRCGIEEDIVVTGAQIVNERAENIFRIAEFILRTQCRIDALQVSPRRNQMDILRKLYPFNITCPDNDFCWVFRSRQHLE